MNPPDDRVWRWVSVAFLVLPVLGLGLLVYAGVHVWNASYAASQLRTPQGQEQLLDQLQALGGVLTVDATCAAGRTVTVAWAAGVPDQALQSLSELGVQVPAAGTASFAVGSATLLLTPNTLTLDVSTFENAMGVVSQPSCTN